MISKNNLEAKNPPKAPFLVQVALRSSLDVFYFSIPCLLHVLIDAGNAMTRDEFKKFWEMIPKANESVLVIDQLHAVFTQASDVSESIITGLAKNSVVNLARTVK